MNNAGPKAASKGQSHNGRGKNWVLETELIYQDRTPLPMQLASIIASTIMYLIHLCDKLIYMVFCWQIGVKSQFINSTELGYISATSIIRALN